MKSMTRVFAALSMSFCFTVMVHAQVIAAGTYSNMIHKGECTGYSVELWKSGTQMFGLLFSCNGQEGDTPVGVTDHVAYDATSGKLSFDARLTLGADFIDADHQPPSKDYFKFDGVLTARLLSGNLYHEDRADPSSKPSTIAVKLALLKDKPSPDHYATQAAWLAANQPMLDNSGPKW